MFTHQDGLGSVDLGSKKGGAPWSGWTRFINRL